MKLVAGGATAAGVMFACVAMVACIQATPVRAQRVDPDVRVLTAIIEKPEAEIDLARAKLTIDQLIDPTVDIEGTPAKLDGMAATVKALAGPRAKSAEIAQVLRSYLYDAGPGPRASGSQPRALACTTPQYLLRGRPQSVAGTKAAWQTAEPRNNA